MTIHPSDLMIVEMLLDAHDRLLQSRVSPAVPEALSLQCQEFEQLRHHQPENIFPLNE